MMGNGLPRPFLGRALVDHMGLCARLCEVRGPHTNQLGLGTAGCLCKAELRKLVVS